MESQQQWLSRARNVARHVNTGWWLHYLLVPTLVLAVVFSALILIARAQGWPALPVAAAAAGALLLAALAVYLFARRRFFSAEDALVRIEADARLNNRLTCARAGVGAWPDFDAKADGGLRWNFRRILLPIAASVVCLAGSALVPVRRAEEAALADMQEPTAWTQVEQWMDKLKEEQVVQPPDIEQVKEQLDALRRQPKEQWYGHSSLEAGDQLRDQTQKGIQELDRNLSLADSVLSQAMKAAEENAATGKDAKDGAGGGREGKDGQPGTNARNNRELDKATQEALSKEWQKALAGLKAGSLKLDPKTMSELSKIDPSKLKLIDPKQLRECKGKLGKGTNACAMCIGKGGSDPKFAMLVEAMTTANCENPGMGGVTRGRADAPLTFSKDENTADLKGQEGVSNPNLENATIGDTVAVKDTAHHVDPGEFQGPQAGGAAQAGGAGEAVWKIQVLPDEQAALERYFGERKE